MSDATSVMDAPAPARPPARDHRPRSRRRSGTIVAVVVVLAVAAVAVAVVVSRGQATTADVKASVPLTPVAVQKRDLTTYVTSSGTLGYGDPVTISEGAPTTAPASSSTPASSGSTSGQTTPTTQTSSAPASSAVTSGGTLTSLVPEGTALARGDEIYRVDNHPRVLFYGATPAYRDLSAASTPGVDVYELEQNLAALGYDPDHQMVVDDTFTDVTTVAVTRWQRDHGYDQTGVISVGQVVFLAGPSRIGTSRVQVGAQVRAGTPVTEATVTGVVNTAFAPAAGSITALADAGAPVKAGTVLFALDGQPTVALIGSTGIHRTLEVGATDGEDVRVLEQNLVVMGFDPDKVITVDAVFDDATAAALRRWQAALGLSVNGVLGAGRVLVVPDGLTVGDRFVQLTGGVPVGAKVLDMVQSHRQVASKVSVTDRSTMKVGDAVQIEFADSTRKAGTVASIGAVATASGNNGTSATVPVVITLDEGDFDPNLVSAPVSVLVVDQQAKGVLAVPTSALVALKEGGFAVQLSGTGKLVAVKPGLYADSWVQVTGDGISEGTQVLVPA